MKASHGRRPQATIRPATAGLTGLAQKEIAGWERTDGLGATQRTRDLLSELLGDD